jgi:hypothetical protein
MQKEIRELMEPLEPTLSVYVDQRRPAHPGDAGRDLQLRAVAGELVEQGAARALVDSLVAHLEPVPEQPTQVGVFLTPSGRIQHHDMPGSAPFVRARFGAPAHVAPLLRWQQLHPAHVIVVIDRTGAEITAVAAGEQVDVVESVEGPDDEIERNAPGGWAQPRYQRRAEDSWRHNAAAVADAAVKAMQRVEADLLLVGGDVRAVQLLEEWLDKHRPVEVRHLPGGRSPDGSAPARRTAVAQHVADYAAQATSRLLGSMQADHGPNGRTVDGVAATLAALVEGSVETLVVVDDPTDTRRAWFGPELLCVDDPTQTAGPANDLRPGRLIDVAVRAAVLTDAAVHVLDPESPAQIAENIGARCRFS